MAAFYHQQCMQASLRSANARFLFTEASPPLPQNDSVVDDRIFNHIGALSALPISPKMQPCCFQKSMTFFANPPTSLCTLPATLADRSVPAKCKAFASNDNLNYGTSGHIGQIFLVCDIACVCLKNTIAVPTMALQMCAAIVHRFSRSLVAFITENPNQDKE